MFPVFHSSDKKKKADGFMLKFDSYSIVFSEIPDEITLAFSITNCQNHCVGCHSPFLREDCGTPLLENLNRIISQYKDHVTCVLFLGNGNDYDEVELASKFIKDNFKLKTALYTGDDPYTHETKYFDYLKTGKYLEEFGGLNCCTTNQRLFKMKNGEKVEDITFKMYDGFQKRSEGLLAE